MSDSGDSTDARPLSANLVDLHISVVPMSHWVEKLNYASHKVISNTFSAGFIRVLPETTVARLRQDIEQQLGSEIFPKDYVFLKHVGRCLALVRQAQEKQLKVKNFLPPHSIMPEIFILPGQPAMYTYNVLPPIQPRLQDLHVSVSDNDSTLSAMKATESSKQLLNMHSSYKYINADLSFGGSLDNTPHVKTSAVHSTHNLAKPERDALNAPKHEEMDRNLPHIGVSSPSHRREIKRQHRHVSGKSSFDNDMSLPNTAVNISQERRGHTSPGRAVNDLLQADTDDHPKVMFSQGSVAEARPNQAKSVLREGPKKRRVRYNMPPESNASSQDGDADYAIDARTVLPRETGSVYANQKSPTSNFSLNSTSYPYNQNNSPTQFTHFHPNQQVTYNSRIRKQFIDTSSHVLAQTNKPVNNPGFDRVSRDQLPPGTSNDSPPHSAQDMHVSHLFARDNLTLREPRTPLKPDTGVSSYDSQTPNNEDHAKPNSANEDSGFVEHESSDDSLYKTTTKRDPYVTSVAIADVHTKTMEANHDVTASFVQEQTTEEQLQQAAFSSSPPNRQVVRSPTKEKESQIKKEKETKSDQISFQKPSENRKIEETKTPESAVHVSKRSESVTERGKLLEELLRARNVRKLQEKNRHDLVQQAKVLTMKTNQKRSRVTDGRQLFKSDSRRIMMLVVQRSRTRMSQHFERAQSLGSFLLLRTIGHRAHYNVIVVEFETTGRRNSLKRKRKQCL